MELKVEEEGDMRLKMERELVVMIYYGCGLPWVFLDF